MKFLKDHAELITVSLTPKNLSAPPSAIALHSAGPQYARFRIGGLVEELSRVAGIRSNAALAVWTVESGGYQFLPGKPVLRFEVHKLWQNWGTQNVEQFNRHFQFGGHNGTEGRSWQGHKWRRTISDAWRKIHIGSQDSEYEVFDFAARLAGLEPACLSSSFGGPQILGSNHAVIGYPNATSLFEAFGDSERWQVLGFFDFISAKNLASTIVDEDWLAFAKVYNGEGNAAVYAGRIKAAYENLNSGDHDDQRPESQASYFHVSPEKTQALNLREGPKPAAIVAVLNQQQNLLKIGDAENAPDWFKVRAIVTGQHVTGFVHRKFLNEGDAPVGAKSAVAVIPEARLKQLSGAMRTSSAHKLHPLQEADMPKRLGPDSESKASCNVAIAKFIDPKHPNHDRYKPSGGSTRTITYIQDFCDLAGVYVPRVWWMENCFAAIARGEPISPLYGETVREMTINALHDWFLDFGPTFGWQRVFDLDALQSAANNGDVCLIVGQCKDIERPGHAAVVLPEIDGLKATRKQGRVTQPVESQAGQTSFVARTQLIQWWRNPSRFRSYGFWRHG